MKRTRLLPAAITALAGLAFASVAVGQQGSYPYPPACPTTENTIVGTEGDDLRTGTPLNDLMLGFGGNDIYEGEAGEDCHRDGQRERSRQRRRRQRRRLR